ncbi:histidine kinase [Streptomyces vinaceus]|uniref:hypothetical protein n=1 Tax=Streptomyces vinaceus TaxID=1960 RepID=UPI00369C9D66
MAILNEIVLAVAPAGAAVASTATWYYRRATLRANAALQQSQKQLTVLGEQIELRDQEAGHLAADRLPALMAGPSSGLAQAGPLLHPHLATTSFGRALQAVLRQTADFVDEVATRTERSAQAQLQAILAPLAAKAARQQSAMGQLLGRVGDEEVLAHAFAVDHGVTVLAQRMQIVGVLVGQEVSNRRADTPLMDILRGATSRIQDYQRVKITNRNANILRGPAAEPIAVALAELLENGTRHSSPGSTVALWLMSVQGGINVVVDSFGPMLDPAEYERAAAVLPGQHRMPLTSLGTRLGFPAVGVLARRSGFQVWLDPNQQGSVRALLHIPARLLLPAPVPDQPQHHGLTDASAAWAASAGRMAAFSRGGRAVGQESLSAGHGEAAADGHALAESSLRGQR